MHISWEDIQTVEALVRTGGVIGAARALGLRHSSVSRRIDALEQALGAPLFLRGARLRPTALATAIAVRATPMAGHAREIEDLILSKRREEQRRWVITTNDVLAPLLFSALAANALDRTVHVHVSDAEADLEPGLTDLALRPGGQPRGTLRGRRLGRLRVGIYRSRELASRKDAKDAWVLPSTELRQRASMRWWRAIPNDAQGGIECNTLLAMRDACVAGLGRAAFPAVLAVHDTRLRLEEELDEGPPVWLLSPGTRRGGTTLRQTTQLLAEALRAARGVWTA